MSVALLRRINILPIYFLRLLPDISSQQAIFIIPLILNKQNHFIVIIITALITLWNMTLGVTAYASLR